MTSSAEIPKTIVDESQLDDWLTTPSRELVEFVRTLTGDILILGAGGKMGPSLAVLAKRAIDQAGTGAAVIAVSRFSDAASRRWLDERGVVTHSADLLDRQAVADIPDAANVLYMVGTKFGTSQNPSFTWAINTVASSNVMERFAAARLVALSTGNIYPFVPVESGGATEEGPVGPVGEYANAALGRERMFQYFSSRNGTPVTLMRLNYAVDLRYGVLTDIGLRVYSGEPVDVRNGYLNCIWQGDANDAIIRALDVAKSPPRLLNLTGPETLSVRTIATEFARLLDRPVEFTGEEDESALLSNSAKCCELLGPPQTSTEMMIRWTADWLRSGGRLLNKPTHFEVRDGKF
ncbi:NAD-dependent epimerase/dehydratase family protein [Blastopirellula marina]|uniref:Epimerase n=1 Tax=Blastopirellula marina TaxID=124 RepID=A0A2S8G9H4_9BACT|nr:NAD(P)-dependent oxidoreductase [Blastopirellula marina]PQO41083.1 epimerase [Blastopirellula marina]PTL45959.1 NAD(P)-dependent oxidoreductase [Blastopirellula marina]